nr:MAG TPA: hypothetical protein [Caudoviricetes sp.]
MPIYPLFLGFIGIFSYTANRLFLPPSVSIP